MNLPDEISDSWWLFLKSGKIIYCNKDDIHLRGDSLHINGTIHNISVNRKDVSYISMRPESNRFRNAFIGSAFIFNLLLLSPEKTPGYFLGSGLAKDFIGLSAVNVFFSSMLSLAVGSISASSSPNTSVISLDGSESEPTWIKIFENQKPKFHLRGLIAVVSSNARREWQKYYESYGATASQAWSNFDDLNTAENLTSINALQSFSMTYSLIDKFELGVAIQSGGIPKFLRIFMYDNGNKYYVDLIGELYTDGYYIMTSYTPLIIGKDNPVNVRFGAGIGIQSQKTKYANSTTYTILHSKLNISQYPFSTLLTTNLEYFLDRTLSLSLTAEYTINENLKVPSQTITEYGGKVRQYLPEKNINTNTLAIGLTIGLHY